VIAQCPLCGEYCEVRADKRNKPYFQCNECALQVFIRGEQGIALLKKAIADPKDRRFMTSESPEGGTDN
jgi:hypothetical protein